MKVTVINWPKNPLKSIYCAVENMNGNMIHDLDEINIKDALETIKELTKTQLNTAMEFGGSYVFQIEGIPRAMTHQIVRNRVGASYSQESMRFVTKEGDDFDFHSGSSVDNVEKQKAYVNYMCQAKSNYERLLELGVDNQDARGILPINTNTKIGVRYNLLTMINVLQVRLCYQSQPFWVELADKMVKEVERVSGKNVADLLVKYCVRYGECGFKSVYDRDCPHRG